ncbi:hypothetical protein [Limnoglobus roseus]|nr:hypothetical protein [Limnoglobus roseus]
MRTNDPTRPPPFDTTLSPVRRRSRARLCECPFVRYTHGRY